MFKPSAQFDIQRRQSGIALVTALIIMMVLTILGVTAMNTTSLEEKMAFNSQDRYLARYLAESSVVLMATPDLLPSPDEAGVSSTVRDLTSADVPKLDSAKVTITFMQNTSYANLPKTNTRAQYRSTGGGANPPVYQIFVKANTSAGTTAQLRASYYWATHIQN